MSFDVAAEAYGRFMGRFSEPLADRFVDFAGVTTGRALDVGCGPGALTERLVARLGPSAVSAADPSEPFVAAARRRCPGVDVRRAVAEHLPFNDGAVDAALAQLVVHFMSDPVAGLVEMRRVTRAGGLVAACVWDHAGGSGPLSTFWRAARDLDPGVDDESRLAGARAGHLAELFRAAGLGDVVDGVVGVDVVIPTFEDWWEPFTAGVGPAGAYVTGLDPAARERLRERCAELFGPGPVVVEARAWAVRALV